jgi:hypothetical protein
MNRIRTAAMAVLFLSLSFVASPVKALPSGEVDNYFWDANWNMIGEKDILCDGTHYTWGVTTAAPHRTTLSSSCDTGGGTWGCFYWDSGCSCYVQTDLAYCGL